MTEVIQNRSTADSGGMRSDRRDARSAQRSAQPSVATVASGEIGGDALGGCDLKRLVPGSLFEGPGDDVSVFFIAVGDCVAETIVGHVINRVLKVLAVLAIGGDHKDIRSGSNGVRRLNIQSYLNIPAGEYPRVRIGRFAFRVNDAEVVLVEEWQAGQLEVGIGVLLDGGISVALHQNDRLAGAVESLFVNRVEAISSLQLLRLISAGYSVL